MEKHNCTTCGYFVRDKKVCGNKQNTQFYNTNRCSYNGILCPYFRWPGEARKEK